MKFDKVLLEQELRDKSYDLIKDPVDRYFYDFQNDMMILSWRTNFNCNQKDDSLQRITQKDPNAIRSNERKKYDEICAKRNMAIIKEVRLIHKQMSDYSNQFKEMNWIDMESIIKIQSVLRIFCVQQLF